VSEPLLTRPVPVGPLAAPSPVVFGPHETNLGRGRALSDRHVAYYARRARGGSGIVITETASVTANDWPYERAPLARDCGPGWESVVNACRPYGTLVLTSLGHAGGQGSSAYSQEVMWAPSRVADVVSREPPAELEPDGIAEVVDAYGAAARLAVAAGVDGVEIDAGPFSLIRQFWSGLTNQRQDQYGADKLLLARQVLGAARRAIGPHRVLALRLCCDELAPWAGITPDHAEHAVCELAGDTDLLTVVRGGPYSTAAYRPDAHTPANFNWELCQRMRKAADGQVAVVLQGSVIAVTDAERALAEGVADLIEMTRAQIAEARLVSLVRAGHAERARPCLLCNQACRVRDNRNPIVSCVIDPSSGHETEESDPDAVEPAPGPPVLVAGAGPAGLECARVLSQAGRRVRILERSNQPGGVPVRAAVGAGRQSVRMVSDWLVAECARGGVEVALGVNAGAGDVDAARSEGWEVVLATGGRPLTDRYPDGAPPVVVDPLQLFAAVDLPDGPVVVDDAVGDWVGVGVAEWLAAAGRSVTLISPDPVCGSLLSRTGDLADANVRLQRAGVVRRLRSVVQKVGEGTVAVEDAWTGAASVIPAAVLVDCGHRVPDDDLYRELADPRVLRAGDCVAPRSILEAILEGRKAAHALLGTRA
jgi:2,4-dienoyl-CoA reductase (NADPH2)